MSKICIIVFFYLSISLANCYKNYCDMYSVDGGIAYRNVTCETPNLCCGTCKNRWCCNDSDLYLNQTSCKNEPHLNGLFVFVSQVSTALLLVCLICWPCFTFIFCVICCLLPNCVLGIKEKLFKRRREPMNPNVRNNRNYSIDLASTNNTYDDNVSNNHRPNIPISISSIDSISEQNNPPPAYYLVKDVDPNLPSYESIFSTMNGKFQTTQF